MTASNAVGTGAASSSVDVIPQEGVSAPEPDEHGFDDVPTTGWRNDAVTWMRSSGVTTGCSATNFCPDNDMTREQQITFLWRYADQPSGGPASPFADVPTGRYFTEPVTWAYNSGITNGIGASRFGTGQPVTRAQAVTFLWRQAGEPDPTVTNPFCDVPAGTYYTEPVRWAFENGITTGTSSTTFAPNDVVTRVQFAAFLSRFDNLAEQSPVLTAQPCEPTPTEPPTTEPPTTSPPTTTPPPRPVVDMNCSDFSSQAAAQAYFDRYYPYYGDVSGLDRDNDGIACESLP